MARVGSGRVVRAGRHVEAELGQWERVAQRVVPNHQNGLGQRDGGERPQQMSRRRAHGYDAMARGTRFHPIAPSTDDASASM